MRRQTVVAQVLSTFADSTTDSLSIRDVIRITGKSYNQIANTLTGLVYQGHLERLSQGVYRLTDEGLEQVEKQERGLSFDPTSMNIQRNPVLRHIIQVIGGTRVGSVSSDDIEAPEGVAASRNVIRGVAKAAAKFGYLQAVGQQRYILTPEGREEYEQLKPTQDDELAQFREALAYDRNLLISGIVDNWHHFDEPLRAKYLSYFALCNEVPPPSLAGQSVQADTTTAHQGA